MSVWLDPETFAALVGEEPNGVLLFRVSEALVESMGDEWSEPVRFRFTREPGRIVEMELQALRGPALVKA